MRITLEVSPEQIEALDFLIKLRNLAEYEDAEAFVRDHVANLVRAAQSEKRVADRLAVQAEFDKLDPADVAAFIASRKLVA